MAREAGAGPRNARSAIRSRGARISERRPEFNGGGPWRSDRIEAKRRADWKMLGVRRGNMRAVAPSHQHAILGFAQIRNAHGEPYSDRGQRDGKSEGRNIRQHALTKIVRLISVPFVARQVVLWLSLLRLSRLTQLSPPTRRLKRGARPEFEHAVLFFRRNGPLGFHCCQLRDILILFSTLATRLTENVGMARMR
jgi:hypothetical protein